MLLFCGKKSLSFPLTTAIFSGKHYWDSWILNKTPYKTPFLQLHDNSPALFSVARRWHRCFLSWTTTAPHFFKLMLTTPPFSERNVAVFSIKRWFSAHYTLLTSLLLCWMPIPLFLFMWKAAKFPNECHRCSSWPPKTPVPPQLNNILLPFYFQLHTNKGTIFSVTSH